MWPFLSVWGILVAVCIVVWRLVVWNEAYHPAHKPAPIARINPVDVVDRETLITFFNEPPVDDTKWYEAILFSAVFLLVIIMPIYSLATVIVILKHIFQ